MEMAKGETIKVVRKAKDKLQYLDSNGQWGDETEAKKFTTTESVYAFLKKHNITSGFGLRS